MEQALQNNFFNKIISVVPNSIIYVFNHQTMSNEYANRNIVEILGYTAEEIQEMGDNMLPILFHPEDFPKLIPYLEKINFSKEGIIHELEYRLKHKEGHYVWILAKDTFYERIPNTNKIKHVGVATDITRLKNTEERINESNITYNAIVEGSMAGYWDWNFKKDKEFMSPTFKAMFGYQDHEVDDTPGWCHKQIHPDDLPGVITSFEAHINSKGKIPYDNEVRYFHKNGSIVWVQCKGRVIEWDENDKPIRMVGSHVNITKLKETSEEIKEKNITYNAIVEGSLAGYWDWDLKNEIFYMSPTFKKMFGYKENEVPNTYEWVTNAMHPEDFQMALKSFNTHVETKGETPYNNDIRYFHKDGSIVWVNCIGNVIEWDENDEPIRMVGSHVNITSLKRAEQELQLANQKLEQKVKERTLELENALEKYHNLYHYAPDMFLSVSATTTFVIECNETLLKKIGYKKDEVIGKSVFNLISLDYRNKAIETFKSFKEYGYVKEVSLRLCHKDGNEIDVILNASSVKDEQGNILYSYSSLRDVTELNIALQDLEELTYATTHDLKAPITNIKSFVSILKDENSINDTSKEAVQWIDKNVSKAESTLKDLISVTKARTLVLENLEDINLEDAINYSMVFLSAKIRKSKAKITYDISKVKSLRFSRPHLNSMLQNIIDNAIKYSDNSRTPEIHIKTCDKEDNYICIAIADNGIGIDLDEHKNQIFGLFKRANDDVKGSGLALYLTKKVLEKTGGKIEVESTIGKGTTFYLYFKK